MSNYPDSFIGTNMDARFDSDLADDELQHLIDRKRELQEACDSLGRWFDKIDLKIFRRLVEEAFDEAMHAEYQRLLNASQSAEWPAQIPPFGTLTFDTPKMKADREYMRRNGHIN